MYTAAMRHFIALPAAALLAAFTVSHPSAQGAKPARNAKVEMTVDSIMRGPDIVGYPPTRLRWSGDSKKLYFDWRKPGEAESSTYVVSNEDRKSVV